MEQVHVRPGRPADAETIVDFQVRLAAESEGLELDRETVTRGVRAVFGEPAKGQYWAAERDGRIVGSMLVTPEWSDWRAATVLWIHSLYVVPEARRRGVFRRMEAAVREMVHASPDLAGVRMIIDKRNRVSQQTASALGYTCEHYDTYEWLKDG
jgi:GNAT superfamily N-acetyltransferase